MIAESATRLHAAMSSRRILYAGEDMTLPGLLRNGLDCFDCFVVRSPVETARTLIRGDVKYSLLLFDGTEAGAELEAYARSLAHPDRTSVIIIKRTEGSGGLLDTIRRRLGITRVP